MSSNLSHSSQISHLCRFDYAAKFPQAVEELAKAIVEGKLQRKFHIVEGLEKAPEALPLLFSGGNTGKL